MKRFIVSAILLLTLSATLGSSLVTPQGTPLEARIAVLADKVNRQAERIERLEKRLEALEAKR
jgi:hypothetical protein